MTERDLQPVNKETVIQPEKIMMAQMAYLWRFVIDLFPVLFGFFAPLPDAVSDSDTPRDDLNNDEHVGEGYDRGNQVSCNDLSCFNIFLHSSHYLWFVYAAYRHP